MKLVPALATALALAAPAAAHAFTYLLPAAGDNVVGELRSITTVRADTFPELGFRYNHGYRELKWANPGVNPWSPGDGATVVLPSMHVLPDTPREGIVINVPEMRLYFFPKPKGDEQPVVITHPISVGREDWNTPKGVTRVVAKQEHPSWYPPASIRKEHAEKGDPLPMVVPPGPNNPLGSRALRLGIEGYLIHGTDVDKQLGIGMRVTHGCIRMFPMDVERLYPQVPVGTPVRIVNQPYKVGIRGDELFVEVLPPLEEDTTLQSAQYRRIVERITQVVGKRPTSIHWNELQRAVTEKSGIPLVIGRVAPIPASEPMAETAPRR